MNLLADHKRKEQVLEPRELSDQLDDEYSTPGFVYISEKNPWPKNAAQKTKKVPPDWLDENGNIRKERMNWMPQSLSLNTDGSVVAGNTKAQLTCHFIPVPFRFCLNCQVSYSPRQRSDYAKLAALGSQGRSTATTVLSLSLIRNLRAETSLAAKAKKLLSFTDNRQDASLQAGHFNDFVEVGLLRAALYKAVHDAGPQGILHDELPQKVFTALNLPLELYASNPEARFLALEDTNQAFRQVLGYRLYSDFKRGWRVMMPNLEQCGLLKIVYRSLEDVAGAQDIWGESDELLTGLTAEQRREVIATLLDYMRRELAIQVSFLDKNEQEKNRQQSGQHLIAPWAIDEDETLEFSAILFPRSRRKKDFDGYLFLSARGGLSAVEKICRTK